MMKAWNSKIIIQNKKHKDIFNRPWMRMNISTEANVNIFEAFSIQVQGQLNKC